MEYIIYALLVLALILVVTLSIYQKRRDKIEKKKYLLKRFTKNMNQSQKLQAELEDIVKERNAWSKKVFSNSDITFLGYLENIKRRDEMEHNYPLLKKLTLNASENKDFTLKLKKQSEALYQQKIEFGEIMLKFESENNAD